MTLREYLMAIDFGKVFAIINKKDNKDVTFDNRITIEKTRKAYSKVIRALFRCPTTRAYKYSWLIQESIDPLDKSKYVDVCFLNPNYIMPKKGLKPWGCKRGQKPPSGYYDCNNNKHNRTFAAGWTPWSKIIDTPIVNDMNYPLEKVVAEILWEMTFYGH